MIDLIEISVNDVVKNFDFKRILDGFDLEVTTEEKLH